MFKKKSNLTLLLSANILFAAALSTASAFASAGSTDGVVGVLLKKYTLTETTPDKTQVTHDGTTLSLKQAGIYSTPSDKFVVLDNKVVDGKVQKQNIFVSASFTKMNGHVLQSGEKVYVTKIESKSDKDDTLKFTILSVDNIDGGEGAKRYGATVSFKFKKGYLSESSPDDVEQAVEAVMSPGDDSDNSKQDNTAAATPATKSTPAPIQRVAAAPAPPPPPPAAATPPPALSIGETSSQVLQAYGMPTKIIDLGKKKTYIYKDIKIVFTDDKISDMQPL